MTDFKRERAIMVESQIRPNDVTNPELLRALATTPREVFVPPSMRSLAYMDGVLRIESAREDRPARYLMAPMTFAKLAQLAAIRKADRVLDIGGGTGYSAAILAQLAASVVCLENDAGLTAVAKDALAGLGIRNVSFSMGSLEAGAPENAPFDVIFLNGCAAQLPDALLEQLAEGGRLAAIMGADQPAKAKLFTKIESRVHERTGFDAGAPLLPGFEARRVFAF